MVTEKIASLLRVHDPATVQSFCTTEVKGNDWWMKPVAKDYLGYGDGISAPDICEKCAEVLCQSDGIGDILKLLRASLHNPQLSKNMVIGVSRFPSSSLALLRAMVSLRLKPELEYHVLSNVFQNAQQGRLRLDGDDRKLLKKHASILMAVKANEWPSQRMEQRLKPMLDNICKQLK